MSEIVNMKGAEKKDTCAPCASGSSESQYPWGLRLTLNDESLEKLKVDFSKFEVGKPFKMVCEMVVTGKSANEYDGKITRDVSLQITGMSKPSVVSSDRMKSGLDLLKKLRGNDL